MTLNDWLVKWGVPHEAIEDLTQNVLSGAVKVGDRTANNETAISNRVRAQFSEKEGGVLWRNNLGAMQDVTGRWVRYGLCNESKQQNQTFKSGDLIGIRPVVITPDMVGLTVGQFVSREIKAYGARTDATRLKAQRAWAALIQRLGGDAKIVEGVPCDEA